MGSERLGSWSTWFPLSARLGLSVPVRVGTWTRLPFGKGRLTRRPWAGRPPHAPSNGGEAERPADGEGGTVTSWEALEGHRVRTVWLLHPKVRMSNLIKISVLIKM